MSKCDFIVQTLPPNLFIQTAYADDNTPNTTGDCVKKPYRK